VPVRWAITAGSDIIGSAGLFGAGAGGLHKDPGHLLGRVACGGGELQLLGHPAGAVHQQTVRDQYGIVPGGEMHHPALAVHAAQNADGQADIAHRTGSGDFASISEAVLAVPYELEAEICIGPGIYREKLVCEKRALTLRGAGADATTLIFGDGGKLPHPDGRPTHTFRSYTAFFSGGSVTVEDLTIANDAGPGSAVGQAIAAYVDAEKAVFRRVRLLGNQDTLKSQSQNTKPSPLALPEGAVM